MMDDKNQKQWDIKYLDKRFFLKWPDEMVVRFIIKYMKNKPHAKVLDLVCGSGRHSELLASEGYSVYGCDISQKSVDMTDNRLRSLNLDGKFEVAHSWALPYKSNFFDFIIAWGSVYYNTFENMVKTIREMHRVLARDGTLLATFIAEGDHRGIHGTAISEKTLRGGKDALDHHDLIYSVINFEELNQLFKSKFSNVLIGYNEWYLDAQYKTCNWIVIANMKK